MAGGGTTIVRLKRRPRGFLLVDKEYLSDASLGLTAMGLMTWMLARPDDWKMHQSQIARATGESLYAVRQAMRRLDECGYVRRSPVRDVRTGRIARWELVVFETRQLADLCETAEPSLFERVERRRPRAVPSSSSLSSSTSAAAAARVMAAAGPADGGAKPRFQRDTPEVETPGGGPPASGFPSSGSPSDGFRTLLSNEGTEGHAVTEERRPRDARESGGPEAATSEPPASADRGVVADLRSIGFSQRDARRLARRYGRESAVAALAVLRSTRGPVDNPRGLVVRAMRDGWTPPVPRAAQDPAEGEARRLEAVERLARRALARLERTRAIEREGAGP